MRPCGGREDTKGRRGGKEREINKEKVRGEEAREMGKKNYRQGRTKVFFRSGEKGEGAAFSLESRRERRDVRSAAVIIIVILSYCDLPSLFFFFSFLTGLRVTLS